MRGSKNWIALYNILCYLYKNVLDKVFLEFG